MLKKKTEKTLGPTRVVAYVRVSTEKQANEGNSLEAQKAKIEAYGCAFGLEMVAIEVDAGEPASSLERPGLQRALTHLDEGRADALLVVKLDRLTRSVRDLCDLVDTYFKEGTWSLLSVSENIDTRSAAGRMMLNILTVVGQWEREAIGERTRAVMQHMRATGCFTGGWPPYGFSVDGEGNLIENADEQGIITRARAFRSAGMSWRSVAAALGTNPRTGKTFDHKQIVRMM